MPHFSLVTSDGDALGTVELGRPDWPEGAMIYSGDEANLRIVGRVARGRDGARAPWPDVLASNRDPTAASVLARPERSRASTDPDGRGPRSSRAYTPGAPRRSSSVLIGTRSSASASTPTTTTVTEATSAPAPGRRIGLLLPQPRAAPASSRSRPFLLLPLSFRRRVGAAANGSSTRERAPVRKLFRGTGTVRAFAGDRRQSPASLAFGGRCVWFPLCLGHPAASSSVFDTAHAR